MSDNFDVKVYDPTQIRIVFAGYNLSKGAGASGYGEDEFITIKQMKPSFIEVEGTDGTVARSKTNTRLCECELTFLQVSGSNDFLSSMVTTDEAEQNGAGVASFELEDLNGTTVFSALKAWVIEPAPMGMGKQAKERKWTIHMVRSSIVVGSN